MIDSSQTISGYRTPVLTVTQLTRDIKRLLEEKYPIVWISGEISNLRIPASGHAYFTLKDSTAQIAAVMFKGQRRNLNFELEDGALIVAMGRLSVYEQRGTYQIILEYVETQGLGALQIAFEQLKHKLAAEGLFDTSIKKPLPYLPSAIGLITSPTGAVIRDMLHVIRKRFSTMAIEIMPVRVQGHEAQAEIVKALALANRRHSCDVLILARGGGSLEDLAPFNSEAVARAIHASQVPVISAVGHETDFTIADFVADMRAPTPSVAAEIVLPVKSELADRIMELQRRCYQSALLSMQQKKREFFLVQRSLAHPAKKVQELQMRIDDLVRQLQSNFFAFIKQQRSEFEMLNWRIRELFPSRTMVQAEARRTKASDTLVFLIQKNLSQIQEKWRTCHLKLELLHPERPLQKGYSITRTVTDHKVVTNAETTALGDELEVLLHKGVLRVNVLEKST